jgi:hypothetical protein
MTKKQAKEYKVLTHKQKIIYDSVMENFPATKHDSAYDIAIQGGVRWNFVYS